MYKSLGGFSWTGLFQQSVLQNQCSAEDHLANAVEGSGDFSSVTPTEEPVGDFDIIQSAQGLHESLTSLKNVSIILKIFLGQLSIELN